MDPKPMYPVDVFRRVYTPYMVLVTGVLLPFNGVASALPDVLFLPVALFCFSGEVLLQALSNSSYLSALNGYPQTGLYR